MAEGYGDAEKIANERRILYDRKDAEGAADRDTGTKRDTETGARRDRKTPTARFAFPCL